VSVEAKEETMHGHLHWKRRAFSILEVLAASTIVAGVAPKSYQGIQDRTRTLKCQQNLRQIGMVLMAEEKLPGAAFYPKGDPATDAKSLVVLMKNKIPAEMLVCPASPPELAQKGLTFLWNDALNGRAMTGADKEWVLVEMHCLGNPPVPPHQGKYHVLYTDGSVSAVDRPPQEILDALERAKKESGTGKSPGS
jgi:prepilin-type processing-associated H-X9-DG protein